MNSFLEYQGYLAEVEFSIEDDCFVGHVLDIPDAIAFDGQTLAEVTQSFHTCIDEYLEMCREISRNPRKGRNT